MRESEFTTFGQWLRFYRTRRDFKMRQIGRLLGVSGQTVKNWEENPAGPDTIAPRPARDVIRRFAEMTGADAAEGERLGGYGRGGTQAGAAGLPERVSDLPTSLQEALGYIMGLDGEVREFMMKLWIEQARPHLEMKAELDRARERVRREIEDMERPGTD